MQLRNLLFLARICLNFFVSINIGNQQSSAIYLQRLETSRNEGILSVSHVAYSRMIFWMYLFIFENNGNPSSISQQALDNINKTNPREYSK